MLLFYIGHLLEPGSSEAIQQYHQSCFTYRTEVVIKTGKSYNAFLSGFSDPCFRLFSEQRLNSLFLLAAEYAIMPDLYKPVR